MKIGIVISGVIIVIFGAVIIVSMMGFPDGPTPQIQTQGLMKGQSLPTDLAVIAQLGSGDSLETYRQAFTFVQENRAKFPLDETPQEPEASQLVDMLLRAQSQGRVSSPFLDAYTPKKPGGMCEYGDAIGRILASMKHHEETLWKADKKDEAIALGRALWALGRQMFEKCVRLDNRLQGLVIMMEAGGSMLYNRSEHIPDLAADIDPWIYVEGRPIKEGPLHRIQENWKPKVEVVMALKPHIGDLLYVAEHDEDISFRLEATYKLGVAKWAPRTRGNLRGIENMIKKLQSDRDPRIAEAAKVAGSFSKEDLHRMR